MGEKIDLNEMFSQRGLSSNFLAYLISSIFSLYLRSYGLVRAIGLFSVFRGISPALLQSSLQLFTVSMEKPDINACCQKLLDGCINWFTSALACLRGFYLLTFQFVSCSNMPIKSFLSRSLLIWQPRSPQNSLSVLPFFFWLLSSKSAFLSR